MTAGSVFPVLSLDRARSRWEEATATLTPVEWGASFLYKREDHFAPLGYGGINGTKLRQLVYLLDRYRHAGPGVGVLTGASVRSPQVSMAALVAAHYGMETQVVLGATHPAAAARHENVAIARAAGAEFSYTSVAYNPQLQRAVARLADQPDFAGWYRLHYGITPPDGASDADLEAFHLVSAGQVQNIPADVQTIMMTAGSCNSCASVLYGIALHCPLGLERVVLVGVGPTRLRWLRERLEAIERASGVSIASLYRPRFLDQPLAEADWPGSGPIELEHHDLHATGWVRYSDSMLWDQDDIDFHPTYEGKMMQYFYRHLGRFRWRDQGPALVWIVGSAPSARAMLPALGGARAPVPLG